MDLSTFISQSSSVLKNSGIDSNRLDTLILIEHVTHMERSQILAHPEYILSDHELDILNNLVNARSKHKPIAQLTKQSEFFGRKFYINDHVLQPRPETEKIIENLLKVVNEDSEFRHKIELPEQQLNDNLKLNKLLICDLGCGSGAIGITAALELESAIVELVDIDKEALKVAKINVDLHTIPLKLIRSDLLNETTSAYDIILANLPYVPDKMELNSSAEFEPPIAIFGGPDGLELYKRMFKSLTVKQHRPLYILTESFPKDHDQICVYARLSGYLCTTRDDFIQVFKLNLNI